MDQDRENWKASFAKLDGRLEKIELIFENDIKPDLKRAIEANAQMAQTLERMDKKLDKIDEINTKMDAILADLNIRPCDYNR